MATTDAEKLASLFSEEELRRAEAAREEEPLEQGRRVPRFKPINRQQMMMRSVDVEKLVESDHPVHTSVGNLRPYAYGLTVRLSRGPSQLPTVQERKGQSARTAWFAGERGRTANVIGRPVPTAS